MIDVKIPSNIKKKEHEKLEKYQGLKVKGKVEQMWEVKATMVPVAIKALGAKTHLQVHLLNPAIWFSGCQKKVICRYCLCKLHYYWAMSSLEYHG